MKRWRSFSRKSGLQGTSTFLRNILRVPKQRSMLEALHELIDFKSAQEKISCSNEESGRGKQICYLEKSSRKLLQSKLGRSLGHEKQCNGSWYYG